MAWRLSRRAAIGTATIGASLLAWWLLTAVTGIVGPQRFPSPAETWAALAQLWDPGYAGGRLPQQVYHSLRLVLLSFLAASAIGVPLGMAMGLSRRFEAFINPTFLLLRPIPPLAWIPLAIVWFGLGDGGKIFTICLAAFVPATINAYVGVRNIDPIFLAAARVHGASSAQLVRDVILPGALPLIFTGLRLSLQASWTTLVAAELVGAFFGLGRVLNVAYQDIFPGMILVGMVLVSLAGAATTMALAMVERRAIPWRAPL
ncbi:MAG: ABC transporter permease [Alphaproteobacteria bacterium]|nr:ABC transporter permease [Alphaproteobacteria bacterium]